SARRCRYSAGAAASRRSTSKPEPADYLENEGSGQSKTRHLSGKEFLMFDRTKSLVLAGLFVGLTFTPAHAAEREQVRVVINLVAAVKMPYPENLQRNRAKTQRVWLDLGGATVACLRHENRRWCFEHIPPIGARAEILRIRNEPEAGISVGQTYYYVDDFD